MESGRKNLNSLVLCPTPNTYRAASGAPGQTMATKADYKIDVRIDDENQILYGEKVTYFNNSPDVLRYLWVQLDQNVRANDSNTPSFLHLKCQTHLVERAQRLTNEFTNIKVKNTMGIQIAHVKDSQGKI